MLITSGSGHYTPPLMQAVRAPNILCSRHFQKTNLHTLLISKINWISVLLQELWLAGLWECGVSFTSQTVVKQWQKCVLAHPFTTTTTSSVCKTYILSWFLASCLSWTTCYYWWECKVLQVCAASTNMPLYTVARSWPLWKEVIGVPGSLV